jgi:nitrite reductase/ring-hydroxylating ferredoxin subunit
VHGARFDLATGAAMNPPATSPIATYPVRVVDGWVEADLG